MSKANKPNLSEVVDLVNDEQKKKDERKPAAKRETKDETANDDGGHRTKRPRTDEPNNASVASAAPIKLFATISDQEVRTSDERHWSRAQCWTLREMLGFDTSSTVPIEWIVMGNYMIDFDYLLDEVPELLSIPRVVVFYGYAETPFEPWNRAAGDAVDFVRLNPSDPPGPSNPMGQRIPYGVHHSKFFLVGLGNGKLRVVIHTANLRYDDIHLKAQAAYVQDFSLKSEGQNTRSDFEETLVSYLASYRYVKTLQWSPGRTEKLVERIRRYDFSSAVAVLIPSTPGYHQLDSSQRRGHLKLCQAVSKYTKDYKPKTDRPIICQFSSMGSLTEKYLHELQTSMDTSLARHHNSTRKQTLNLQIVYPTVEEVRTSVQGYVGGQSVPGTLKNVSKPFLRPLYHRWSSSSDSNPLFKSKNIPHIKTFYQLNEDSESLDWFVVTSHNLSKAAWGEIQNSRRYGGQRLFIRHWELGVFLSPQLVGGQRFVPWSPRKTYTQGDVTIPLPYKLHPEPYQAEDQPWAVDCRYKIPDAFRRYSAQEL